MHWSRSKEKKKKYREEETCFIPDDTSTSTGKISSSWEGAGWLALIRINAVWFVATLPTKLTLMSALVS